MMSMACVLFPSNEYSKEKCLQCMITSPRVSDGLKPNETPSKEIKNATCSEM